MKQIVPLVLFASMAVCANAQDMVSNVTSTSSLTTTSSFSAKTVKRIRYMGSVEGGVAYDFANDVKRGTLLTTHGVLIRDKWFAGAGLGFDNNSFEVYLAFRAFIDSDWKRVRPYFECKAGYGYGIIEGYDAIVYAPSENANGTPSWEYVFGADENYNSVYLNPAFGISVPFGHHHSSFVASVNYSVSANKDYKFHSLGLRVGFTF